MLVGELVGSEIVGSVDASRATFRASETFRPLTLADDDHPPPVACTAEYVPLSADGKNTTEKHEGVATSRVPGIRFQVPIL